MSIGFGPQRILAEPPRGGELRDSHGGERLVGLHHLQPGRRAVAVDRDGQSADPRVVLGEDERGGHAPLGDSGVALQEPEPLAALAADLHWQGPARHAVIDKLRPDLRRPDARFVGRAVERRQTRGQFGEVHVLGIVGQFRPVGDGCRFVGHGDTLPGDAAPRA